MTDHPAEENAKQDKLAPTTPEASQLDDSELDAVSGGINPQPLPPMERSRS